jgi:hypothetical protein
MVEYVNFEMVLIVVLGMANFDYNVRLQFPVLYTVAL